MNGLSFANPEYLYFLLIIPLLIVAFVGLMLVRKRDFKKFGNINTLQSLMPEYSSVRPIVKFGLLMLSLSCLILAIARPRGHGKQESQEALGSEIMIILDISNSMKATDMYPNRLENAKNAISSLVKKFNNDHVGLIAFAGEAYVQVPITNDYQATDFFVQNISCDMISEQGTALGTAINLGIKSFSKENEKGKAIILITDGENHESEPDPIASAKLAKKNNIVIHTVGIGSLRGEPIPLEVGSKEFLRDNNGQIVMTKLDETILKEISQETNGVYVKATNSDAGLGQIYKIISQMEKSKITKYSQYDEKFVIPLFFGLIFFILSIFVLNRKNRWIKKSGVFD